MVIDNVAHMCKVAIAHALTRPAVGKVISFLGRERIRSHGLWIDVSDSLIAPTVKAQLFWNLYEGAEVRFVRKFLAGQRAVIDLGGSLGIAALHALDVMDPRGELVCVEAHPVLAAGLRRRFRDHPTVRVVEAALAYDTDQAKFAVAESSNSSRLYASGDEQVITVPAKTLADVVADAHFDRFALISDIEGAEVGILEQDAGILERCDLAVIELHETANAGRLVTVEHMRRRLHQLGFKVLAERGPVVVLTR